MGFCILRNKLTCISSIAWSIIFSGSSSLLARSLRFDLATRANRSNKFICKTTLEFAADRVAGTYWGPVKACVEEAERATQSAVVTENRAILGIGCVGYCLVQLEFCVWDWMLNVAIVCGFDFRAKQRERTVSEPKHSSHRRSLIFYDDTVRIACCKLLRLQRYRVAWRKIHDTKNLSRTSRQYIFAPDSRV